jgi:RHS repeat-associated protein
LRKTAPNSLAAGTRLYDTAGRLWKVTNDAPSTPIEFLYDTNGNRRPGTGTAWTYDAQDRLTSDVTSSYAYLDSGELSTKTTGSETTTYSYTARGQLTGVAFKTSGTTTKTLSYVVDGEGRRVSKKVGAPATPALVRRWLYRNDLQIAAELDGNNAVVARFIYGTRNVPEYMVTGAVADCNTLANQANCYRIISDHLGSVRLVVRMNDGTVVQKIDYDEWGNATCSTPATCPTPPAGQPTVWFQPFGFAGGLYDPDTKLVHFGAREYDPAVGRWTSRDPVLFRGGEPNLFV